MNSEWWRGAVVYQIYPRSFADSNNDGCGDLAGVLARLDYVARLGVDAIWLSPFFRSPMKDFGYDISDYRAVDPLFGSLEDFDALLARAHELGLKVIIDQVYSHTSDEHAWFTESRASRDNSRADWYVWADAKVDGSPPNNWQALFGGPSWEWEPRRRQYYLHNFLVEQPDLNVRHPPVQDALIAEAKFWLDRGVDGLRLDVANFYVQDKSLRDNPSIPFVEPPARPHEFQRHLYDRSQPETLAFVARLRALLDNYPDRFAVGEIEDEEPLSRQREYTDGPDRLHSAYSFFLLRAQKAAPALFLEAMAGWDNARGWPAWSLSNHDVPRMASRLARENPQHIKLLLAILLSLRGTAFLYQGDELGLPQAEVPFEKLRDPEAIRFWPHGIGRDGARTPMPWRNEAGGGFSDAEPWLPLDQRHLKAAAEGQEKMEDSILAFTRRMIAFRKNHEALRTGGFIPSPAPHDILMFERQTGSERLICVFNLGDAPCNISVDARGALLTIGQAAFDSGLAVLPSWSGLILEAC